MGMESEGGSESTLGCEGSAQRGCEQIWAGRGSGRPGEAAPHRGRGECRGHKEMPKGFRRRRQRSRVRMRGMRAETEQEEAGGTPVTGGGGQTWFEVLRNHCCALQKTDSKWGRVRVDAIEEAPRIIEVRDDGGQDQSESSGNGEMGSHSRHMLKVEPKDLLIGWVWL